VAAAGVNDRQHVGAGQELDDVVVFARVGVELEDPVTQAAAAQAAIRERLGYERRRDAALL
jgi:hypothetical protein